uniref:Transmembrane protein 241 n=2 Tax=Octopus bimaculoides TaxID=37653 RepID=A0A0L8GY68_OCTBM|eukprot:XP_014776992.1 PREDICTED: transmembrane protein 241-like isoform X1 [Octopus bimaculoides]
MLFKQLNVYLQCILFCLLFIATCYVNKYVLSVLKFTHPTIFQGWQCFVGVIFIKLNMMTGNINLLWDGNKKFFLYWLPEFMLFVISIYSGSKALANISIPAFLAVLNSCALINHISICILHWNFKIYEAKDWIFHFVIGASAVGVVYSDPMYEIESYFWLYVHIISFSAIVVFIEFNKDIIEASKIELLYYNYIFSVIFFIPGSYLLGDIFEAANFKHLYLYKFYMGCLASGILGTILNLLRISLQENSEFLVYNRLLPITHIMASFLSLLLFEFHTTAEHNIWIAAVQLVSLLGNFTKRKGNEE